MSTDQDTNTVIDILKNHLGFEAERIPEAEGERADISAWKNGDYYLFEVKSRDDHPALMEKIEKRQDYQVTGYNKELKRSNKISSILEKASSQLVQTPKPNNEFSCVWFRAVDHFIPDEIEFIKASIFGIKHLLVSDSERKTYHIKCYYFDYNDFYCFKNINAVVIDNGNAIHICINNHSNRITEFRNSELYKYFSESNALIDPDKFTKDSGILVADIDCPRNQVDKLKDHIQKRYGLQVNNIFAMKSMAGVVKGPNE